jgi:hypothetical protein
VVGFRFFVLWLKCLQLRYGCIFKKIILFLFFLLQLNIFLMFSDHFEVLMSKIIFKNKKILFYICFGMKNTLKNNRYHTPKHTTSMLVVDSSPPNTTLGLDATASNPTLGLGTSVSNPMLDLDASTPNLTSVFLI